MECYNCKATLTASDVCESCGANVKIYKRIIHLSNFYYNEGLAKAQVRDLSGALDSLKRSLYFNKKNVQARNLMGLVYFEMGETVTALSEWVISKNFRSEHNAADKYLRELQKNPAQLDTINQTIKKYNQALMYCRQKSEDLAIIQLKKVLSLNSKLIRAHQLLALIYMKEGRYDLAQKYLKKAIKIDTNNTTTLRYMKETEEQLRESSNSKKGKKEDLVSYQNGNETIIQPTHFRESSAVSVVINILIGVAMGIAITCFLVVPGLKSSATSDKKSALTEANNTITIKDQTISSLQDQVDTLTAQVEDANSETESSTDKITSYSKLVEALNAYNSGDKDAAGTALQSVNADDLDDATKAIYESMGTAINTELLQTLYDQGYSAYNSYDYQTAATNLQQVVDADASYSDGYAVYYLAQSYRKLEDNTNALTYYQKVVELYPGTERASTAQSYIDEMAAQGITVDTTADAAVTDGTEGTDAATDGTDTAATDGTTE